MVRNGLGWILALVAALGSLGDWAVGQCVGPTGVTLTGYGQGCALFGNPWGRAVLSAGYYPWTCQLGCRGSSVVSPIPVLVTAQYLALGLGTTYLPMPAVPCGGCGDCVLLVYPQVVIAFQAWEILLSVPAGAIGVTFYCQIAVQLQEIGGMRQTYMVLTDAIAITFF